MWASKSSRLSTRIRSEFWGVSHLCSSVAFECDVVIENSCNPYRYEANYSWLLSNITGNVFDTCPKCMKNGICNDPHANPVSSPLLCTSSQSETMRAYTNSEGFDPMYSPVPYVSTLGHLKTIPENITTHILSGDSEISTQNSIWAASREIRLVKFFCKSKLVVWIRQT